MALVAKLLSIILAAGARVLSLLFLLFLIHLGIQFAFPYLKQVAEDVQNRPLLEAQVQRLRAEVVQNLQEEGELRRGFASLKAEHQQRYEEGLERLRQRFESLQEEKREVEASIRKLRAERASYCRSFNPFKRWTCWQMEEQQEIVLGELGSLLSSTRQHQAALESSIAKSVERLQRLKELTPEFRDGDIFSDLAEAKELRARLQSKRETRRRLSERLDLKQNELSHARGVEASLTARLLKEWERVSSPLLMIVLLVVAAPYLQRSLAFYILMPLVAHARPLRLSVGAAIEPATASGRKPPLRFFASSPSLKIRLSPGEELCVRADFARPIENTADCEVRTQLLFRWASPFISYAAGLTILTALKLRDGGVGEASLTVAAPKDPDSNLMRVELNGHPGLVVHPRHLIGISGKLQLKTRWRIFNLHAWSRGQLRYIIISGTGMLIVDGLGETVGEELEKGSARIEQAHVIAFDTRLAVTSRRTETFVPYLLGKTPLVDSQFEGSGTYFWQKSVGEGSRSLSQRSFDALFGALGKFLGF